MGLGGFRHLQKSETTLYVETTGDDNNNGLSVATAIKSLDEVMARLRNGMTVQFGAGDFELSDHATNGGKLHFVGDNVKLIGTTTTEQALTVTGAVENVISISETVAVNALRGLVWVDTSSPVATRYRWVLSNTANDFTLSCTTAGLGGFDGVPPNGAVNLSSFTRIIDNVANPGNYLNRLHYSGSPTFEALHFDYGATGGFARGIMQISANQESIWGCKFTGFSQSIVNSERSSIYYNWVDGSASVWSEGCQGGVGGGNVWVSNWIARRVVGLAYVNLYTALWNLGNQTLISNGGSSFGDGSSRVWLEGTAEGHQFDPLEHYQGGKGSRYTKTGTGLVGVGPGSYDTIYKDQVGGAEMQLNTAAASITHTTYIALGVTPFNPALNLTKAVYEVSGADGDAYLVARPPNTMIWD